MRGKLVLLLLLVTFTVAPTEGNFLDDAKDTLSGAAGDTKDAISGAFGGAKDFFNKYKDKAASAFGNIKDKGTKKLFDALPDKVKEWMGKGDFSNANVTELLEETPPELWNAMKPAKLESLGRENLDKLLMEGKDKLPPRVIAELERIRAQNMTKEQARKYLMDNKKTINDMSASELNTLKKKLGNPKDFSKTDITEMKDYVLAMPPGQLFKIKDKTARMTIVSYMKKCQNQENDRPAHCPPEAQTERLVQALQKKNRGKPDKFTNDILGNMTDLELSKLTIPEIRMIKPVVLNSRFDTFTSEAPADTPRAHKKGLVTAKRLLEGQGITMGSSKTAVEVNAVYDRMNYLSQYVLPSFVPPAALEEDEVLKGKLIDNAEIMANKGVLDPKESRKAFKEIMKGWTVSNLTVDQMRNMGGLLAMASPSVLMNLTKSDKLTDATTLVKVANGLQSARGPGFRSKARTVLDALTKENWRQVDQIPAEMIEMVPASTIVTMTESNIKAMLMKRPKLTDEQKNIILKKFSPDRLSGQPAVIVNSIPFSAVKAKDATDLKGFSETLPQGSTMALMAVSKELDKRTNKSLISPKDLQGYDSIVQKNLGPKHIDMIPKSNISEALRMFKMNGEPSVDTCLALKEKLSEYSQDSLGADDDMEALEMLTAADIENTPPCVIGAFSNDALKKLDNVQKEVLLKKMQELEDTSNIPKSARTIIVREGLKAMDYEMSLSEVDVEELKHAAADLEGARLKQLSEDAKNAMINYFNTYSMNHMKPCLNSDQRNAIKDMILSVKGDASTWTTTDDVNCLLETLPESTLNKIPTEVMAQCSCDRNIQGYEDYVANREAQCMYDIGEKEFMKMKDSMKMVKEKAIEAALDASSTKMRRRKRQATSESGEAECDKAAVGGGDALTTSEIKGMAAEDVMSCLADFGETMMPEEKAKALAEKVYMAKDNNLFSLTSDEIQSLGYILRGFSMEQLKNFTKPASDSDVAALGVDRGLTQDQLTALAMKVQEWKSAETLEAIDLKNVNQIICGFNPTEVAKLTADAIMNAMTTLRNLGVDCNKNVTMKLADMAFVEYKKEGPNVTDAMVRELGGLVGNLAPENIQNISAEAMAGLTVQGMEAFGKNEIKSLKIEQIEALPRASAMALTSDQKEHFNKDMMEALEKGPLKDPNMKTEDNGASSFVLSSALCMFGITATLQLL